MDSRVDRLSQLASDPFDVAVIGGGIIGCGIARDAALRGLRVALFEARDFGSGTTAGSTRIVHGGLRYLETLDLRLVRLDLQERETLLRIASHLVRPLEFLIPFLDGAPPSALKMRLGLALYDALSASKSLPSRRWLPAAEARAADPVLQRSDIRGAAAYYDARVDSPERLALENVLDARAHGAVALNYCAVSGWDAGGRHTELRLEDRLSGGEARVRTRVVVNATGAWFEQVAGALTGRRPGAIRTTKGIHAVCRQLTTRALVFLSAVDRRLLFAIPRGGLTWIGTTDTDFDGDPAGARASREDVDYLVASARPLFPKLRLQDVLYTTAGVRALVRQRGAESSVSRMHRIVQQALPGAGGVISVLGGKITGYRAIAEAAVDAACRRLGASDRRASTAERPLPGAAHGPRTGPDAGQLHAPAPLLDLYGARAQGVLDLAKGDPVLAQPLAPPYPDIGAQVVFAVRHESCVHLSDFLRRRTLLGASADQGREAAAPAAALMAAELGWTAARTAEEIARYEADIALTEAFRS